MPHAFIGVDVMVVYEAKHLIILKKHVLLAGLPVSQLHVFTYSERAGNQSLDIDYNVPHAERKKRNDVL